MTQGLESNCRALAVVSLDEIAAQIKECEKGSIDLVVRAAQLLVQAQDKIEPAEGREAFLNWIDKHVGLSATRIGELLQIGRATDAHAEVRRLRELAAKRAQRAREKIKEAVKALKVEEEPTQVGPRLYDKVAEENRNRIMRKELPVLGLEQILADPLAHKKHIYIDWPVDFLKMRINWYEAKLARYQKDLEATKSKLAKACVRKQKYDGRFDALKPGEKVPRQYLLTPKEIARYIRADIRSYAEGESYALTAPFELKGYYVHEPRFTSTHAIVKAARKREEVDPSVPFEAAVWLGNRPMQR